jgi:hypothetical protein
LYFIKRIYTNGRGLSFCARISIGLFCTPIYIYKAWLSGAVAYHVIRKYGLREVSLNEDEGGIHVRLSIPWSKISCSFYRTRTDGP